MYNFELIIRARTSFETEDEDFIISKIEVSGIPIVTPNEEGSGYPMPYLDRRYTKFWMGKFSTGEREVDVHDVVLIKIENFPRKPVLSKPRTKAMNRISITKIRKSKRNGNP